MLSFELHSNNFSHIFLDLLSFLLVAVGNGATRDGKQRTNHHNENAVIRDIISVKQSLLPLFEDPHIFSAPDEWATA